MKLLPLLFLLFCLPVAAALPAEVDGQPLPSLAPMLERTTPAVVNIATRGKSRHSIELPLSQDPLFKRFFDLPMGQLQHGEVLSQARMVRAPLQGLPQTCDSFTRSIQSM